MLKNLSDDHGASSVIQHRSNEEHQVGVTHLCHSADLPADPVHSMGFENVRIHLLDGNLLSPKYSPGNIPPGTSSKNPLINLDFFGRDTPEPNVNSLHT